ncbi:MAG: ABC transporter permease [Oscillospiraceae bacterium]|jgi:peptide/nickel transport system permease protein
MMLITRKQKLEHNDTLEEIMKKHGQWKDVVRRLFKNKLAVVGLAIVVVLLLSTIFADFITKYDYSMQDPKSRFAPLSSEHFFGADNLGRDLFSRILYGGRISLLVALMSVILSLVTGGFFGATAGYFGGKYEHAVMRIMDIIMAIPGLLLAVAVSAALGSGVFNTALAISISGVPASARILRATVLSIRDQEFVEAARATGSKHLRIIFRHILPNTIAPLIVDSTLRIGMSILQISGLSFIGLGVQPPTPEWGSILASGRTYIRDYWPLITFPGVAIVLTLFGFNLLGDGLRDALDPRLKQ